MKHAGHAALSRISDILGRIRDREGLVERKPGVFHRKSQAFLHFHEDPAGIFADLRGADGFDRFPVNTPADRRRLLREIDARLKTPQAPVGKRRA